MKLKRKDFLKGLSFAAIAGACGSVVGRGVPAAPRRTFLERLAEKGRGPFFIAHRGCQSLAPENTVASFVCAARLGLQAIETDIHLAADGALVCIHDDTLKRMFGVDREVSSMRLEELRKLTPIKGEKGKVKGLKSWPKEALRIPTFGEYLDVCEKYDKVPFIETKGSVAVVNPILDELRRRDLIKVAVMSSIQIEHIRETRRIDKDVFIHHIFSTPELLDELAAMGNAGLSYNYKDLAEVPEGLVAKVHAKGVKMCLRAGDTPETVVKMVEMGLDYIPTNVTVPLEAVAKLPRLRTGQSPSLPKTGWAGRPGGSHFNATAAADFGRNELRPSHLHLWRSDAMNCVPPVCICVPPVCIFATV